MVSPGPGSGLTRSSDALALGLGNTCNATCAGLAARAASGVRPTRATKPLAWLPLAITTPPKLHVPRIVPATRGWPVASRTSALGCSLP